MIASDIVKKCKIIYSGPLKRVSAVSQRCCCFNLVKLSDCWLQPSYISQEQHFNWVLYLKTSHIVTDNEQVRSQRKANKWNGEITSFKKGGSSHIYMPGKKFYWKVLWFIIATFSTFDPILHWTSWVCTDEKVDFWKLKLWEGCWVGWNLHRYIWPTSTPAFQTVIVVQLYICLGQTLSQYSPLTLFIWDPTIRQPAGISQSAGIWRWSRIHLYLHLHNIAQHYIHYSFFVL